MPAQVQQVILNLVTNAIEAVHDSGQIELSLFTGLFDINQRESTCLESPNSMPEFHVVQFKDNGYGMGDATIKHLFDPFYASKSNRRGFGLASVLEIVKGHGGTIAIESTLGNGTEFRIYFPAYLGESDLLTGEESARYVTKLSAF